MDIKEQAHKYLINKGCLSVKQTYTAFQVERMLAEFAQEQVKIFRKPDVVRRSEQFYCAEWDRVGYTCEYGQCDKCKKAENMPE